MRNIVAGNWKCHKLMDEASAWMVDMNQKMANLQGVEIMVAAPAPYLGVLAPLAGRVGLLAQNVGANPEGAHTGEYTAAMLKSCGVVGALVGHSERRARFGDTEEAIAAKVDALVAEGLEVIFCCGETLQERQGGRAEDVVLRQMESGVLRLGTDALSKVVVAYEPVWAIGTGQTATSAQAQEMHAAIRGWMSQAWGEEAARHVPVLYGGSCKATNASELFSQPDINGGLIGGASLIPEDFWGVIEGHPAAH